MIPNDPSECTVLFVDRGMFTHFALAVARTGKFKRVLYAVPDSSPFPASQVTLIGTGFPELERVDDLWAAVKAADLVVFPDVYDGSLQEHLREMGKLVWGCGGAEELELDRYEMKELQRELGLPVQPYRLIKGLYALRKHLWERKDKYVKISRTRGDMESWHWTDKVLSASELDALALKLGPAANTLEYLVEDPINDAQETGCDWNWVNSRWAGRGLMTYEIKDCGCVGVVKEYAELPAPVRRVQDAFAGVLKGYRTSMFWSTEIRVKNGEGYFIDPCCRLGAPPSELLENMYSNWPEMLLAGAQGIVIDPEPVALKNGKRAMYGCMAIIHIADADHWQTVRFPEKFRGRVCLRNSCRLDDSQLGKIDCVAPQLYKLNAIGAVAGIGETLQEAIDDCQEIAAELEGDGLYVRMDSIPKAMKEIAEGEDAGIEFSDEELPKPEEVMAA